MAIALGMLAFAVVPLVDKLTLRWFIRDMDIRSRLIANILHEPLAELLQKGNKSRINSLLLRSIQDERLLALGFCSDKGDLLYRTPTFPKSISCSSAASTNKVLSQILKLPEGAVHVASHQIAQEGGINGYLILVHDTSFMERRSADTRKYIIMLVLSQFTGAANELYEALIFNPYHVEQTAEALYQGLTMPEYEQQERMRSMRTQVRDFNVNRWAGRMLLDAARVRQREKLATRIGRE